MLGWRVRKRCLTRLVVAPIVTPGLDGGDAVGAVHVVVRRGHHGWGSGHGHAVRHPLHHLLLATVLPLHEVGDSRAHAAVIGIIFNTHKDCKLILFYIRQKNRQKVYFLRQKFILDGLVQEEN